MFLIIQKNIDFCSEFYVYIVVWIFVVIEYDEMNYNIVYGVFYNVFWSVDSSYIK
jgi:hypothetical protein